jgi:predicted MFS family arabinose efflux permease
MALNSAAMNLGTALGASLGGLLLAAAGFGGLGWGAMTLYVLSAGLVWWSRSGRAVLPQAAGEPSIG